MNTKTKILELLEANRGKSLSGEEIARTLNISRAAVWKAIKSLEQSGHSIQAATKRGYSLAPESNVLSLQGLLPYLPKTFPTKNIHVFDSLESTNKTAKELAINGCPHGSIVIADRQTAGKGRQGRNFYSPPSSGLYISFVMRPASLASPDATLITSAAAVAVCRAIEAVAGVSLGIKWVNDIMLGGKKAGGILTEAMTNFENGCVDWVVVGVGINITTSDFPGELAHIATSVFPPGSCGASRNRLAGELVFHFLSSDTWLGDKLLYNEYKNRQILLGEQVSVTSPGGTFDALALDIDRRGRLVVQKKDGSITALSSSEVSVKSRPIIVN